MTSTLLPSTLDVREAFGDEIAALGGNVADVHDDGKQLLMRAVLAGGCEVLPRDRFRSGVALRTSGREILVHPYVFREVCKNGAIVVQAISTRRVERVDWAAPAEEIAEVLTDVREAVQSCGDGQVFSEISSQIRSTTELEADLLLANLAAFARLPGSAASAIFALIARFEAQQDRSLYGLMNSITSVARDTTDPDLRWRLEELGGGVLAHVGPQPDLDSAALALTG